MSVREREREWGATVQEFKRDEREEKRRRIERERERERES
jgi:hypothetical protein